MALLMIALVVVVAIVSVLPTYVMLQTEMTRFESVEGANKNGIVTTASSSTADMVKELRSRMELLKSNIDIQSVSLGIMPSLFEIKPDGVYFSGISFSKSGKRITVRGMADTNKDLGAFINAIKNQREPKIFLPIDNDSFPFASMSQPKDVPFTLEIKLKEINAK